MSCTINQVHTLLRRLTYGPGDVEAYPVDKLEPQDRLELSQGESMRASPILHTLLKNHVVVLLGLSLSDVHPSMKIDAKCSHLQNHQIRSQVTFLVTSRPQSDIMLSTAQKVTSRGGRVLFGEKMESRSPSAARDFMI